MFIKLTNIVGDAVYLNPKAITGLGPCSRGYTEVYAGGSEPWNTKETPEEILAMITTSNATHEDERPE